MHTIEASLEEIENVASYISQNTPSDTILFLTGDLASGKTTLAKELGKSRGVEGSITSPTFSLQHKYADDLYHYDLYRKELSEIYELGLIDEFDKSGWHMVEWGSDELKSALVEYGYHCIDISISDNQSGDRVYKIGKLNA